MFRSAYWPFLWITLVPLVSVPASIFLQQDLGVYGHEQLGLGYGPQWVMRDDAVQTLAPALLNILVFIWLLSGNARTVWSTLWAGALGVMRIALPVVILLSSSVVGPDGISYVNWQPARAMMFVGEIELWLGGIILWLLFSLMTRFRDRYSQPELQSFQHT